MISITKDFIRAERSGNWYLHLKCVQKMIPFFHASVHFQYAKCAHLFLQDMRKLRDYMDEEELARYTSEGYFTIRRTHNWASADEDHEDSRKTYYYKWTTHWFVRMLHFKRCGRFWKIIKFFWEVRSFPSNWKKYVDLFWCSWWRFYKLRKKRVLSLKTIQSSVTANGVTVAIDPLRYFKEYLQTSKVKMT